VQITNAPISNSFFLNTNNTYSVVNLDATNPPTGSINFSSKTKPYSTIIGKQTIFHYVK